MSKFEELCDTYAAARKASADYANTCNTFTDNFVNQMQTYFQCPVEEVQRQFDDKAFLHLEIKLTLLENPKAPNIGQHEVVIICISIKKTDCYFFVKVEPYDDEFRIGGSGSNKLEDVFELIFSKIKESYQSGIKLLNAPNDLPRKLGFAL